MTEHPLPQRLRIGEGKISGYLSIFLAVISLAAVICFHFPEYFTTPEFRVVYPLKVLRWVLLACLVLAFAFALTSFLLSGKTRLGLTGVLISALAIVLGGNTVEIDDFNQSIVSISLDWLLIDILVLSAIFIPVELFLPKRTEQTKFHLESPEEPVQPHGLTRWEQEEDPQGRELDQDLVYYEIAALGGLGIDVSGEGRRGKVVQRENQDAGDRGVAGQQSGNEGHADQHETPLVQEIHHPQPGRVDHQPMEEAGERAP